MCLGCNSPEMEWPGALSDGFSLVWQIFAADSSLSRKVVSDRNNSVKGCRYIVGLSFHG